MHSFAVVAPLGFQTFITQMTSLKQLKHLFQITFSNFRIGYHVTFIRPMLSQTKNTLARNTFASLRCQRRGMLVQMI